MVKILYVRDNPSKGVNGIGKYCDALYQLLMDDDECKVLPVQDYPLVRLPFVKNYYRIGPLSRAMDKADVINEKLTETKKTISNTITKVLGSDTDKEDKDQ
jgi:hypothetical protein